MEEQSKQDILKGELKQGILEEKEMNMKQGILEEQVKYIIIRSTWKRS